MAGRQKLIRFDQNDRAENVIQEGKEIFEGIKGKWNKEHFKNAQDIVLELGCGRGEYTTGLAEVESNRNFIGVDIKGNRIWKGSQVAKEKNLSNAAFLRTHISLIETFFEKEEVAEIWVTFPDPRPKKADRHRRLISPRFLDRYRKVLKKGGIINLKTDSFPLYEYACEVIAEQKLEVLAQTEDLYNSEFLDMHHGIKTTYEKKYLAEGIKINYLRFRLG